MKSKLTYVILITTTLSIMAFTAQAFKHTIYLHAHPRAVNCAVFIVDNLKEPPPLWSVFYRPNTKIEWSYVLNTDKSKETFVLTPGAWTKLQVDLEPEQVDYRIQVYTMLSADNNEGVVSVKIKSDAIAVGDFCLFIALTNKGALVKPIITPDDDNHISFEELASEGGIHVETLSERIDLRATSAPEE
jgi:hypothetical protein